MATRFVIIGSAEFLNLSVRLSNYQGDLAGGREVDWNRLTGQVSRLFDRVAGA